MRLLERACASIWLLPSAHALRRPRCVRAASDSERKAKPPAPREDLALPRKAEDFT